jgi:hypothetical protein
MSGSRSAGFAPILRLDNIPKTFERKFSFADFQQRTHYGSNHIAQETIGLNGKHPSAVLFGPSSMVYLAVIGLNVRMELTETGKVGIFEKDFRSLIH